MLSLSPFYSSCGRASCRNLHANIACFQCELISTLQLQSRLNRLLPNAWLYLQRYQTFIQNTHIAMLNSALKFNINPIHSYSFSISQQFNSILKDILYTYKTPSRYKNCHCRLESSRYHSNGFSSVNTLLERKLRGIPRTTEQYRSTHRVYRVS